MRFRFAVALGAALSLASSVGSQDQARFLGAYRWTIDDTKFGGFSGIEISNDGSEFTTISDRGNIISGRIERKRGRIFAITAGDLRPIYNTKGEPVTGKGSDTEGLAFGKDGRMFISFEGKHRVWSYAPPFDRAIKLTRHADFKNMKSNSSLEVLAIDNRGHLFTIPEISGAKTRPFPVYRLKGDTWDIPFRIERFDDFKPVGADFGPDGWLYLLERDFTGYGFRTRVRRFDVRDDRVNNVEVLFVTGTARHDNLEGISVWQSGEELRLTMISDDNFRFFQRTEIVEYGVAFPAKAP